MILRLGSSWQTVTADLALILFMVTAQAIQQPSATPPHAAVASTGTKARSQSALAGTRGINLANGTSLAIYRPETGADLSQWLDSSLTDDRQAPTVYMRYSKGGRHAAIEQGSRLVDEIEQSGHTARLVLEPSEHAEAMVVIGFNGSNTDGTNVADPE